MTSIDLESLLTTIYVLVDDWYQAKGQARMTGKPGAKATFSDSEMLTLMLAQDFIPYPGESQYIAFIRANLGSLFPRLLDQSQFNRRARRLLALLECLRQEWVVSMTGGQVKQVLLDTKPIPVIGTKRSKRRSDFAGSAAYGYCAARNLNYFGYKLVMLTDLDGMPLVYDLVPANVDERQAAESVLWRVNDCDVFGDKGFLGQAWQAAVRQQTANRIWTPKRANQTAQNPSPFDCLLNRIRERIETTFHQLQNTGRNIERLLAKTVHGLCTRIALKVTCLVLKRLLQRDFGISVQSFSISH
jgi:hypothetical protein